MLLTLGGADTATHLLPKFKAAHCPEFKLTHYQIFLPHGTFGKYLKVSS